jgi:hypothetical protein
MLFGFEPKNEMITFCSWKGRGEREREADVAIN